MKKYKSLIAGSLMAAVIMSAPAITFASDKDVKNNREDKSGIEKNINKFSDKKDNSNSIWNRISKYREDHKEDDDSIVNKVPTISDLRVAKIKSHKAFIYWNTDIKADSAIWYSKTSTIDTTVKSNYSRKSKVLKHKIVLKNLEENTKYYAIIQSKNDEGTVTSSEISFTTSLKNYESVKPIVAIDVTAPKISGVTNTIGATNTTISWVTDEPSTSSIFYSTVTSVDINNTATASIADDKLVKEHSISIPGLASGTIYHFILKSADALKNAVVSSEFTIYNQ